MCQSSQAHLPSLIRLIIVRLKWVHAFSYVYVSQALPLLLSVGIVMLCIMILCFTNKLNLNLINVETDFRSWVTDLCTLLTSWSRGFCQSEWNMSSKPGSTFYHLIIIIPHFLHCGSVHDVFILTLFSLSLHLWVWSLRQASRPT